MLRAPVASAAVGLPAMARATGDTEAVAAHVRARLESGLQQIAFFVVPSAVAGAGLAAFSGGLLGLYARTPGMRKEGTPIPTQ